jgi:hypothetical protein
MKRWISILSVFSMPVILWAQNTYTPQPEKAEVLTDNTESIVEENQNDTLNRVKKENYDKGYEIGLTEGQLRGFQQSQSSWFQGGCCGGLLLNVVGSGGVWLLAKSSNDYLPNIIGGDSLKHNGFIDGYLYGYLQATKTKKTSAAFRGGLYGTIGSAVLILSYTLLNWTRAPWR